APGPEPKPQPAVESRPEPEPDPIVATPAPKPSPKPRPKPPAEPSPEPMRIGYLTADAVPWAKLVVDGKEVETTPVSRYPMKVGHYTLVFAGPDGREERRKVTIEEGKTASVRVDFTQ